MAKEPLGSKPWKPHPQQITALWWAVQGLTITGIAHRMGVPPQQVSFCLSGAYKRLGITRANTPGPWLGHQRRHRAAEICKAHGWWPEGGAA